MPAEVVTGAVRMPRRARYLVPRGLPRRGELIAACTVVVVAAHILFAQLTIVIAVLLYLTGKATRWHRSWLIAPAAVGAIWTLVVGPRAAAAGFTAGPARVAGYLGASGHQVSHALHIGAAFAGAGRWLPEQLPLALLAGVAEAALATWLSWLHTDEWNLPRPRPGLLVAIRRLALTRMIRAGGVVTRDGACLGIAPGSGGRVALSWRDAAGGVLVCGSAAPELLSTSFQLVHAALRRRKPVLAVDLTGDIRLPRQLAAACAAAGVPLQVFGGVAGAGAGSQSVCYEPFRYGTPAHRAALVTGMLNWDGPGSQYRRGCAAYLEDVFELLDAAPGDPRVPVLDEVLHLLNPAALRARAQHVPAGYARRDVLAERTRVSASLTDAEPAATAMLAGELRALRVSEAGWWLRQPVGGQLAPVDLGRVVSGRGAALFRLAAAAPAAPAGAEAAGAEAGARAMLIRLVCQDLLALGARLHGMGVDGDGVVWLAGCQAIDARTVADLIAAGPVTGLAVVATTSSGPAASELAECPNVLLVHRVADPAAARRLAAVAAPRLPPPGSPDPESPSAVTADDLALLGEDEFLLTVAGPRRLVPRVLVVPARIAAQRRSAPAVPAPERAWEGT
jgi:hypothetical protein